VETAVALHGAGFRGANVTIPHKEAALTLADEASDTARAIGAANTLVFEPSRGISADNTDAPALLDCLPVSPRGKTALVLGAGGSARAAVWALLSAGAHEVRVWNRHPERARRLCRELGCELAIDFHGADMLVNCTPVGLDGGAAALEQLPFEADELAMFGCVVDFVYADTETPLVRLARSLGVAVVDGLDVLVAQGALSFVRFTGLPAPRAEMRAAARRR
jgi:shikimate dehydrogenase